MATFCLVQTLWLFFLDIAIREWPLGQDEPDVEYAWDDIGFKKLTATYAILYSYRECRRSLQLLAGPA